MNNKPPPQWVTAWPEWYGIEGNVTVVPLTDYAELQAEVERLKADVLKWSCDAADYAARLAAIQTYRTSP